MNRTDPSDHLRHATRVHDVAIIGAGPIGLELAVCLRRAGVQQRYTLFIENTHEHVGKIAAAITGRWPEQLGSISSRSYDLPLDRIEAN